MPNLTQLRLAAREIFDETLRAVDPEEAVRRTVHFEEQQLRVCDTTLNLSKTQPVYSIAIGKAALGMARALDERIGASFAAGVIATKITSAARREQARMPALPGWEIFQGGHPEPNEQSLAAARACLELIERADAEHALLIFLVSGGGSAMLEWPIDQSITLADLRTANRVLIGSGASIAEINAVRRSFSAVKGGRLARRAQSCDQLTLIVSDVPSGEERNVASGPTMPTPSNIANSREVIERYNLRPLLPETILHALEAESTPVEAPPNSLPTHFVLLDNQSALEAALKAARRRGFIAEMVNDISDQPIVEGCARLLERSEALQDSVSGQDMSCLISGGEFACPVRGDGLGGRNLETALRLAQARGSGSSGQFVALCAGTDGIDGNSPAAGAIIDSTTIDRARAIGLDPADFIERSDAYSFFVALGDVVATGPTGTNVRDIRILLGTRSS